MKDPEKGVASHVGFAAAASWISRDPDNETYIFRRFNFLTARNLVHLQNDLLALQSDLREFDRQAEEGCDSLFTCSMQDWEMLKTRARDQPGSKEQKVLELTKEIETILEKYQKALLRASEVAKFAQPCKRAVKAYRSELESFGIHGFAAEGMLEDVDDLIALSPPQDRDLLSVVFREHWPFPTRTLASQSPGVSHFQERHLQSLVSGISLSIAAVLLVVPIVVLYLVRNPGVRLVLLILFIVLFAVGIRISTSASRDSIFAASAAYAAVLVVFVSGDLGNTRT